jgi:hypothetical protein
MSKPPPRKLHRGHFAFMRALAQGIDERTSWDRYLRFEGEHTDLRVVRRTIAWIRDEFAAAARREQRPGTARLILLDPEQFPAARRCRASATSRMRRAWKTSPRPSRSKPTRRPIRRRRRCRRRDGAPVARRGARASSSANSRRCAGSRATRRRTRGPVTACRRGSIPRWPSAWSAAASPTLAALVAHINQTGARWWVRVPGVGERKAGAHPRLAARQRGAARFARGLACRAPAPQVSALDLAAVVPRGTALVPYEKFVVPPELDGRAGRHRAPLDQCRLAAQTDHEAIGAWLAAKCVQAQDAPGELSPTQRSYRKEAERLLLWAVLERRTALSSLGSEDAAAYRQFLGDPPAAWCGPRHNQRWSPLWRPLEGPLAPTAVRQAMAILRSLFAFLMRENYLLRNPFAAMTEPARGSAFAGRSTAR